MAEYLRINPYLKCLGLSSLRRYVRVYHCIRDLGAGKRWRYLTRYHVLALGLPGGSVSVTATLYHGEFRPKGTLEHQNQSWQKRQEKTVSAGNALICFPKWQQPFTVLFLNRSLSRMTCITTATMVIWRYALHFACHAFFARRVLCSICVICTRQ